MILRRQFFVSGAYLRIRLSSNFTHNTSGGGGGVQLCLLRKLNFDILQQILITQGSGWVIRLRCWWSRNDLTIDGWQLVALVSVHGRGSLLDVDGLLHLAFQLVLFSV